ncbi:uncharacterized protein LOC100747230 [Bombus impatiens]|uniref:Uncharacterized protein LOC100747230 n=1 Tax=Bombus impatiens TaxID=132113 RepID=A0A6P3E5S8_BOMIM|nr:uncharacterized protein LOC100747230 [Bombus impatiens]
MLFKLLNIFVTLLLVQAAWSAAFHDEDIEASQEVQSDIVSYYDPYTGTELDVDTSDALVAMIQQRSLCKSEQNGYGCCVGVHVKKMKASICAKLTNGNDPKLEITANGKTIFSHSAKANTPEMCGNIFEGVKVCEQTQVSVVNNGLRVCANIRLKYAFFKSHINIPCFTIGKHGISVNNFAQLENQQEMESKMYDEVNFEQ